MKAIRVFMSCAFALSLPMAAQTVSYGLSAGGVVPTSDLHTFDRSLGSTFGGFIDLDLGGGSLFRPRIDSAYLLQKKEVEAGTDYKRKFWSASLSLDYLNHFSGSRNGLFGLAGVGIYHMEAQLQGGALDAKRKNNEIGGSIGVGYTFDDHWDATFRYTYTTFNSDLPSQLLSSNLTAGMLALVAEYRF